jgi:hypothetical protein
VKLASALNTVEISGQSQCPEEEPRSIIFLLFDMPRMPKEIINDMYKVFITYATPI